MTVYSIDEKTTPCSVRNVTESDASLLNVPKDAIEDICSYGQRIHVLVDNAAKRTKSSRLVFHVHNRPFPKGAFRRYSQTVLIASPELCYLEMACEVDFVKLVEVGFFMCGTYTLNPNVEKINGKDPLSTKQKILSFINRMGSVRGCAIARKALELVYEGSASPRETKMAILLCFPVKMGGYGFKPPLMNYRIDFSDEEQKLFGRPYVVLDLYWPEYHFGIEYDGGEGHSDEKGLSRDRRKSGELNYLGINVLRVDKEQLSNPYQVYVLAVKCARMMGKYLRKPTKSQWVHHRELFNKLMR